MQFYVWSHERPAKIRTILFLGTVQIGKIPKHVSELCPSDTIVVQGAPHWKTTPGVGDIPTFMYEYTEQAFRFVRAKFSHAQKLQIIAESQAAPGALWLASHRPRQTDRLAILQPLGFNSHVFNGSPRDRIKKLVDRVRKNFELQLDTITKDRHLVITYLAVVGINVADTLVRRSVYHYKNALEYDALNDYAQVADRATLIVGSLDQLFPYREILRSIEKRGIKDPRIITIDGVAHAPLGSVTGSKLLKRAFEVLEKS